MRLLTSLGFLLLFFYSFGQNDWDTATSGKITYTGGKVGIGTTSPTQDVTIDGDVNIGGENNRILRVRHVNGKGHSNSAFGDLYLNYHNTNPVFIGRSTNNSNLYVFGKVGIGRSSPQANLHLSSETSGDAILRIEADIDNNNELDNPELQLYQDAAAVTAFIGLEGNPGTKSPGTNANSLLIGSEAGTLQAIHFIKSDDIKMTINDNVGIGTTTPSEKLDVNGAIQSDFIRVNAVSSAEGGEIRLDGPVGMNDWRIDNRNGAFRLHHSGTTYLQLNNDGRLGIGTTSIPSGYKLAVDGKIISEEVKVQVSSSWPDYVFSSDYKLMPLEEIEKFIQSNHHLPEIPSAQEIESNGLQLGEMNRLLLQKIEELTLHMIEMNKNHRSEINELKKEIQSLKSE